MWQTKLEKDYVLTPQITQALEWYIGNSLRKMHLILKPTERETVSKIVDKLNSKKLQVRTQFLLNY